MASEMFGKLLVGEALQLLSLLIGQLFGETSVAVGTSFWLCPREGAVPELIRLVGPESEEEEQDLEETLEDSEESCREFCLEKVRFSFTTPALIASCSLLMSMATA